MGFINRLMKIIDGLSEVSGTLASYLILGSLFTVFYEIAMRYVFSKSQDWTLEMSTFLFGTTFVLHYKYIPIRLYRDIDMERLGICMEGIGTQ